MSRLVEIKQSDFLVFCHNLYDKIHGKEKIDKIFSIPQQNLSDINKIYYNTYISRLNNIENYISYNTKIKDNMAASFYVNALQHFYENN